MVKLKADFLITFNENNEIIENGEILFDKKIIKIGHFDDNIPAIYLGKNSVLMPGMFNTHTHLEFSAHKTELNYGTFIGWLHSVIENREELLNACKASCFKNAIDEMKESGVVGFGEISSTGMDLKACVNTPLKVAFFNEIIGSNPAAVDMLYNDLLSRYQESKKYENEKFKSYISIHSPYSVHPILAKKVLELAKKDNSIVSAHFMESFDERIWLDEGKGEFKTFFEQIIGTQKTPFISSKEFLEMFDGIKTHFIHSVYTNDEELDYIASSNASIAHCPISNRLLNSKLLNLEQIKNKKIKFTVATDGLSSNYSLNLFKELRATVLMHNSLNPYLLADDLLKSVTKDAAEILGFNSGVLDTGYNADIIGFKMPFEIKNKKDLMLNIILHTNKVDIMYINGVKEL